MEPGIACLFFTALLVTCKKRTIGAYNDKGQSVVPILQSICRWSGMFYREEGESTMPQCRKCDYRSGKQRKKTERLELFVHLFAEQKGT